MGALCEAALTGSCKVRLCLSCRATKNPSTGLPWNSNVPVPQRKKVSDFFWFSHSNIGIKTQQPWMKSHRKMYALALHWGLYTWYYRLLPFVTLWDSTIAHCCVLLHGSLMGLAFNLMGDWRSTSRRLSITGRGSHILALQWSLLSSNSIGLAIVHEVGWHCFRYSHWSIGKGNKRQGLETKLVEKARLPWRRWIWTFIFY